MGFESGFDPDAAEELDGALVQPAGFGVDRGGWELFEDAMGDLEG